MTSKLKNDKDMIFQVFDWDYYHEDDVSPNGYDIMKYVIRMYGTTEDGKKIFVKVDDFTPFLYVKLPDSWTKSKVQILVNELKQRVDQKRVKDLKSHSVVNRHDFWTFSNYKKFQFLRLVFYSWTGLRAYERILRR